MPEWLAMVVLGLAVAFCWAVFLWSAWLHLITPP